MYLCEMTGGKQHIHKYMVLFYYKVSIEYLPQDLQSSNSFGKIQKVKETELSQEKI